MLRTLLAMCLLLSAAAAQSAPAEAGREKLLGQTLDQDNKPWPGATVRLLFRPIPARDDFGLADVVEVRSDADGQFRAALLPCCAYSVYASEAHAGGSVWFSGVQEGVTASTHLILRKAGPPRPPRSITVSGIDAWTRTGHSVSVHAVAGTNCRQITRVPLDEKGQGTVPPQPGEMFTLELVGNRGQQFLECRFPDPEEVAPRQIQLSAPVHIRATVRREGAVGEPIPGATVRVVAAFGQRSAPVGTTDAAGRCELWLPRAVGTEQPGALHAARELQADVAGCAITSTRVPALPETGAWNAEETLREVTLVARGGYMASGRVLGADRRPVAGLTMLLICTGSVRETENRRSVFQVWPRSVTTGADGTFTVPSLDPDCPFQLVTDARSLILPEARANRAGPVFPIAPLAILARGAELSRKQLPLGDLGPAAAAPVLVEVRSPDGAPARNARVECLSPPRFESVEPACTDQRGRVALLLPAGKVSLLARSGTHLGFLTRESGLGGNEPRVLNLEAALTIRGRVVDQGGKPVGNASVVVRETHTLGTGDMTAEERSARLKYCTRGLRGETDAEGRFQLWFVPVPGMIWGIAASLQTAGRRFGPVVRIDEESVTDLELTVPGWDAEKAEATGGAGRK